MIHGLWPQNNKTSYPEYCVSVSYNNPHGNLLEEMNKLKAGDFRLYELQIKFNLI